jgi:hypothetical protein
MPAATVDLLDTLKSVEIGGHQQCKAPEIFHLRWATDGNGLDYSTLDEAPDGKWIAVAQLLVAPTSTVPKYSGTEVGKS